MNRVPRVLGALVGALSVLLLGAGGARADVVAQFSASEATEGDTSVSLSLSTPAAGSGRLLAVGVSTTNGATVSGVSYAGQALTKRAGASVPSTTGGAGAKAEVWTLSAPPVGSDVVTVTLTSAAPAIVGATSFTGVDPIDPVLSVAQGASEDASNSASLVLADTTPADGMFGVLALGNVANTSSPFLQGSVDTVVADDVWNRTAGGVHGAGATRSGNTGQNQAPNAGIVWRWNNDQSALNPHVDLLVGLRKAAAAVAPTVTTGDPTAIASNSANLTGNVTSDGNGTLTKRGIAYCPGACTPTLGSPGTADGGVANPATGPFTYFASALTAGQLYTYRAYAANAAGTSYGEAKTFTTLAANKPPVASAIPSGQIRYRVTEGDSLSLDASESTDPEGDPLTYAWDVDGDGEYDDATGATPTLTAAQLDGLGLADGPDSGIIVVRVSDASHQSTATAALSIDNAAPSGTVGDDGPVYEGSPVTFSITGATDPGPADRSAGLHFAFDANGDGAWEQGDGSSYMNSNGLSDFTSTPDDNGTLHGRVAIIDHDDGVAIVNHDVTVDNVAPTATLTGDGPVAEGTDAHVTFTDASDPSAADTGAGFHYAYDVDGNGDWDIGGGTYATAVPDATATVPTRDDGTIAVRAAIIDKDDGATIRTTDVTVTPAAPTLTAAVSGPVQVGAATGLTLDADDASAADAAAGFTYAVDWGDGQTETVSGPAHATATHVYAAAGTYTVTVVAGDEDGATSAAATASATVTPAPTLGGAGSGGAGSGASGGGASGGNGSGGGTPGGGTPVGGASTPPALTPITVDALSVSPRCVKASIATTRSVKVNYKLSGAATVRVSLQRALGSKAVRTCPPPRGAKQQDGAYKPGSYAPVSTRQGGGGATGSLTIASGAKGGAVATVAAAKGTRLKAGTYLVTVTPLRADGTPLATPARVKFWVLKG
jgi:hypothetical protein